MPIKTMAFDEAKYLESREAQAVFLGEAMASGDSGHIAHALGVVARARGMSELARETGLTRQSLYKALSEDGNPTLDTVMKVARYLGIAFEARLADEEVSDREAA